MRKVIVFLLIISLQSCFDGKEFDKKGIQVNEITEDEKGNKIVGLPIDSLNFETRPVDILPTHYSKYKLTPVFKVNYAKNKYGNEENTGFTGTIQYYYNQEHYEESENYYDFVRNDGEIIKIRKKIAKNVWNDHILPGFSAVTGYNIVNVSLYNVETKTQKSFFEKPVLIKTIYFPSVSTDTLNYQPVKRNFYMISAYDSDTNKDGFVNIRDLRKMYLFDLEGNKVKRMLAENLSVFRTEYDKNNDLMQVFARLDKNNNGQIDEKEPTQIHWIDLKNPENVGVHYSY